jgi:hypothetical protein
MVKRIRRPRVAAAVLGMSFSGFNEARKADPDFQHCLPIPIGKRAIGFDDDDLLRVQLRKAARRDGLSDDRLDEEVERRLIKERARESLIAEEKERLAAKVRNEKRNSARAAKLVAA